MDHARSSGLDVTLSVEGALEDLAPAVDVSAYRIVQEALTNAIRHAGPCRTTVSVARHSASLQLEVTTDRTLAAPSTPKSSGRGLIGMGERVRLLGGELDAGPSGNGFRVRATLPLTVPA